MTRWGQQGGFARLLGRLRREPSLPPDQPYRVIVLLTPDRLPLGGTIGQATAALRRAILALPGAEGIHVQPRSRIAATEAWLSVAPPGAMGKTPLTAAWQRHLAMIEGLVVQTLAEVSMPVATASVLEPI